MSRPFIGISGSIRNYDGADRAQVNAAYARAVAAAGGLPIILTPALDRADAKDIVGRLDGLVLTGGHDIDPRLYDTAPSPALGPLDPERDAFDLALFRAAAGRQLPILGVCRGLQVINVALGGTLWQDLPSECPGKLEHDPRGPRNARSHPITVSDGSRLARALGSTTLVTNSFHHQAIRDLGEGLVVSASAPDSVIEGIEGTDLSGWLIAVQWHPEEFYRERDSADMRLFEELVKQAA